MNTLKRIGTLIALAACAVTAHPLALSAQPGMGQGMGQGMGMGQGKGRMAAAGVLDMLARPKLVTMLVIGLLAMALLLTRKMKNPVKVPILLLSTFLYGVAANLGLKLFAGFSMHPSPVCAVTKSVLYGFRPPMIAMLLVILALTLVGPKLFCGWVCPLGAAQELIAMLADKLRIRRRKWNFRATQAVRVGIFMLFVALSLTAVLHTTAPNGQVTALSLYDYLNAFHGYEMALQPTLLDNVFHFLPFLLTLGFAFVTYRPFCYLVCPVGLLTNVVENAALFRVVLKRPACNDCGACAVKSPCPTVPEILKDAAVRPDCFSCTVCVNSCCPKGSLEFGAGFTRKDAGA
ncbi:MAG TPA: 4Fe-4S binding protein [Candidatus Aminicenantes bacterium]|nr:4Fe-4S binding protein [Candidatus Aminicenantes bacterium]